jgi:hypothetical protein
MMTMGRLVGISALALGAGFGGGIWFIGSGAGFRLIGGPAAPTAGARSPGQPGGVQQRTSQSTGYGGGGSFPIHRADRNDLQHSAGCEWVIEPAPLHPLLETNRYFRAQDVLPLTARDWMAAFPERGLYSSFALDTATGGVRSTLVEFTTRGRRALDLRPVLFDRAGNRYVPPAASQSRTQNASDEVLVSEFVLDPAKAIPREEVVYGGVERVVSDGERQVTEAAQDAAREKGMAILPAPQIGKPYNFDLTTVDGKRLRAEDFRGKAVLIGVWNSEARSPWLMGWLQGIRKAYKDDEIGIIGISFDESVAKARATLDKSKPGGPLVVIPNDPKIHDLWCKGAQITRFPFYFLLDRDGILRYTSPYHRLFENLHIRESVDLLFGRVEHPGLMRTMTGPPRLQPRLETRSRPSQPAGAAR